MASDWLSHPASSLLADKDWPMLSFATEFPVPDGVERENVCDLIRAWLGGSRYTLFKPADLVDLGRGESWEAVTDCESIESLVETTADVQAVSIVYKKLDDNFEWITTIVLAVQPSASWISVRVECEPRHPMANVPSAKKPVLVKLLLNSFGGGIDGGFKVTTAPVIFAQSEVDLATDCVAGKTESYLPIVYISAPFSGPYLVDPHELANELAGMAHVVVEPNRAFSITLMEVPEVQRRNPYGGTIALYWPQGGGRRSFFVRRGTLTPADIQATLVEEVTLSLIHRRPLVRCTVAAVKELRSRRQINVLKDGKSAEIDDYIAAFEDELLSKSAALEAAESEIHRLKAEIRRFEAHGGDTGDLQLHTGGELDFYDGELLTIVCEAFESELQRVTADSRAQHVLQALIDANPVGEGRLKYREQIKALLRGYQNMDAKTKKELEQMGFSISDQGKHHKVVYHNDDRYTLVLPKSGSDFRGGLNAAGDFSRLLFR